MRAREFAFAANQAFFEPRNQNPGTAARTPPIDLNKVLSDKGKHAVSGLAHKNARASRRALPYAFTRCFFPSASSELRNWALAVTSRFASV